MGATPFEFKHGKGQTAFDTFLHDNKNKETNFKISSTRERERERSCLGRPRFRRNSNKLSIECHAMLGRRPSHSKHPPSLRG